MNKKNMEVQLKGLNTQQREAVLHSHESEGPLLILAGAGSGEVENFVFKLGW